MKDYKKVASLAFNGYNSVVIQAISDEFFPNMPDIRKEIILKILDKRSQIGLKIMKLGQ